jgi:hypothetical protein
MNTKSMKSHTDSSTWSFLIGNTEQLQVRNKGDKELSIEKFYVPFFRIKRLSYKLNVCLVILAFSSTITKL